MAEEAEEIGVEHLLRDIRDVAAGTLSTRITSQLQSLQGLHLRLRDIGAYLGKVLAGDLPVNHAILGNLQDVFNLLPGLSQAPKTSQLNGAGSLLNGTAHLPNGTSNGASSQVQVADPGNELARAMAVKTNDQLMSIYLSSLIRAITAFHDLIENKIQNRQRQEEGAEKEREKEKEKDKKEGEGGKKDEKAVDGEVDKENRPDGSGKAKK